MRVDRRDHCVGGDLEDRVQAVARRLDDAPVMFDDGWIDDLALVTGDQFRERLAESGATLIGYRQLRDAMKATVPAPSAQRKQTRSSGGR